MIDDERRHGLAATPVSAFTDADLAALRSRRERLLGQPGFFGDIGTIDGKLRLIDLMLKDAQAVRDDMFLLESLGVLLGDAVGEQKGMSWYMLETSAGRVPCIGLPGLPVKIPPIAILGDAIMEGQTIKARDMFDDLCRTIDDWSAEIKAAGSA